MNEISLGTYSAKAYFFLQNTHHTKNNDPNDWIIVL